MATDEVFSIYSDKEKVLIWNEICMKHDWAKEGELEKWLKTNKVKFSNAGSAIPDLCIGILDKEEMVFSAVMATTDEGYATLVLQILTGVVRLATTSLEEYFWWRVVNRMVQEFNDRLPIQILPKSLRDKIK